MAAYSQLPNVMEEKVEMVEAFLLLKSHLHL